MKNELKIKFINHLNHRSCSGIGFTLIELLVVMIIVGILAAIALPNFVNQTAKAKQTDCAVLDEIYFSNFTKQQGFRASYL